MTTRVQKQEIVQKLANLLQQADYYYIIDTTGLDVAAINTLRKHCYAEKITYRVAKNTLIKKALEQINATLDEPTEKQIAKGFSALLIGQKNYNTPAHIIKKFRKTTNAKKPVLKGANLAQTWYLGNDQLKALLQFKSQKELLQDLLTLLQSPSQTLLRTLQTPSQQLTSTLKTLPA